MKPTASELTTLVYEVYAKVLVYCFDCSVVFFYNLPFFYETLLFSGINIGFYFLLPIETYIQKLLPN